MDRLLLSKLLFLCLLAQPAAVSAHTPARVGDAVVAGYLENVWFAGDSIAFQAKLDSGANSGSLNAPKPQVFHRDGKYWVRFTLTNTNGHSHTFETLIKNTVRVRRAGTKVARRFLVDLEVCIGGYKATSEFSLADRRGQSYQILIGRKFLGDKVLVDAGEKYRFSGQCLVQ